MSRWRADEFSGDLFSATQQPAEPLPGSMNHRVVVSELVSDMLSDAAQLGMDRFEVADQARSLSGCYVSKSMLDGYASTARKGFNLPFWMAPVLKQVCNSSRLSHWYADVLGARLIAGPEILDAEIGRTIKQQEEVNMKLRELRRMRRGYSHG